MELPVVSMSSGAPSVRLLARSVDEYLHRVLAAEDIAGKSRELAEAAGEMGSAIYAKGSAAAFGPERFDAYLATKAGMYCDVAERLVYNHVAKGDQMSSLITGEWYMRKHFSGWARPYEFNAQHLMRCGRDEEARDTARMALRMPWWSLQQGYEPTASLANIPGSPQEVFTVLNDEGGVQGPIQQQQKAARTAAEEARLRADELMDMVAASGVGNWDDIRPELSSLFQQSGLEQMRPVLEARA